MFSRKEEVKEDETLKTNELYRRVFSSPEGKLVLGHILADLGMFNELNFSEEEMALHNAGVRILNRIGIINAENFQMIIDVLMNIPLRKGKV